MNDLSIFFGGTEVFETSQRVAKAISGSDMVPAQYKGNISNTLIALDVAARLSMPPLLVMQNLHIIHGKPAWSSKALIAMFNACGRFGPLKYKYLGEKGTPEYGCFAYTKSLVDGDIIEGPLVTMDIANKEGWLSKKGSKWQTFPDLMLRYRASAWLINTCAPDISFGLNTADELRDTFEQPAKEELVRDITPKAEQIEEETGEIVEVIEPEEEPDFLETGIRK